jgi:hypothetical protein
VPGQSPLTNLSRQLRRRDLPPIFDLGTTWYQRWYFDLRLEEELIRAKRHDFPVSVIVITLMKEPGGPLSPERMDFNNRLSAIKDTKLRRTDIPAVLSERAYAICLPHTDKKRCQVVVDRISRTLKGYRYMLGVAEFPGDAEADAPMELLTTAARLSMPAEMLSQAA